MKTRRKIILFLSIALGVSSCFSDAAINLEQYARKANETGSIYAAEISNLKNHLGEI